jgi:RsmE family RNA methyltransferase
MNLVLLREADWIDAQSVLLRGRRAVHLREVLGASVGDVIRVGLLGGAWGQGCVEAIAPGEVQLTVSLGNEPLPPRHRFDLVLALPRPKMLRRILRTVAEFGVANLHLINSARVEKSYWQSPLLQPEQVEAALIAGLERSRDTILPLVHLHRRYRPFVEDQLPELCGDRPCWITDPGASRSLADTPAVPAVVMIGPEGGFVPFEVELAQAVVAQPVHLGSRILSVDTALPAVLAQALPW